MTTTATSRATIAEIAAEAAVSVPTVSKVLNGRPDVAPTTRARVEATIDRHGYAGSDLQGLGVLRAARELGLRVPQDLSVVGYDDLPVAEWIWPPLTTIRQPLREMASTATRMVLDLAENKPPTNLRIDLATELIIRESTAPPPPDAPARIE